MNQNYRYYIDMAVAKAENTFGKEHVSTETITDNDNVYDIGIKITGLTAGGYSPQKVSFSHDKITGYYMDIDDVTLEFGKDETLFAEEITRYLKALREGKVNITGRR